MHVLTVRQPYAWAIFHAGKDVDNRSRATTHRGPLAIASARAVDLAAHAMMRAGGLDVPDPGALPVSVIIGIVRVTDCTRDNPSQWARVGVWHWALADPRPLARPQPHRGYPGIHVAHVDV